ncbi:hypothetical protein [Microbulbifer spongiae]|uniref:DUF4175 domain-containing protein n=1 Tax=Microbulbifer spongiae TaxID=2944933 RepID=A0ABY9E8V5_9GAMM|nr:hypothetical protein [Microbulbifer sp. MI-G]WKD49479.1 hypothetical protein M8T91_16530 [Microbulbifer sp. MI-G]
MKHTMGKGLQTINAVYRRWQLAALQPYLWLGTVLGLLAGVGVFVLNWPQWLLPAWFSIVLGALLMDRCWHPAQAQLCRQLDRQLPQLQDSSQLLWQPKSDLSPVQQLQRERIDKQLQQVLRDKDKTPFGPPRLRSPLAHAVGACLGLLLFIFSDTVFTTNKPNPAQQHATRTATEKLAIARAETRIQPPAYTGLAIHSQSLQINVPEQARVQWHIEFNRPIDSLEMLAESEHFVFLPKGEVPGKQWQLQRTVNKTDFYQLSVQLSGTRKLLPGIYNIQVQKDKAPEFAFEAPSLRIDKIHGSGSNIPVKVLIKDDYQVSSVDLFVTLASGTGENLRFREKRIPLASLQPNISTNGQEALYDFTLPIEQFSMQAGDELYWYLEARDNREPSANVAKSQHFILRWPQAEIFGLSDSEGMAIKVLPEYFRSQRQLIIDTKALLAEREQLQQEVFRKRSEGLAYEQNLLRMRYGRFLGEEDSEAEHVEHTSDQHGEEEAAHNDVHHHPEHDEHQAHSEETAAPFPQRDSHFEQAERIAASVGHLHDNSEHATLFDPKTKELLRSALNAMWSSWRDLSVIEPQASLPHQHRALRFIKEVQQASRIYLQRVGFEAPPLDENRRLSGDRSEAVPEAVSHEFEQAQRAQVLALMAQVRVSASLDTDLLQQVNELATTQAADIGLEFSKQLRLYQQRYQQPECTDCRHSLIRLLYRLLPEPKAAPSLPLQAEENSYFSRWLHKQGEHKQ